MASSNLMEVCRLCLDKDRVTVPIFEGEGVDREICLKIGSCLPVKVSKDDPLPKKICDDCTYKVELLYTFWNTTANAEKQLHEWLGLNDEEMEVPSHLLKTEMVILKEDSGDLNRIAEGDLFDESQDALENEDDDSAEESEREEDPGGGDFQYEDGMSNDPSSIDTSQTGPIDSSTVAGPSGTQPPQLTVPPELPQPQPSQPQPLQPQPLQPQPPQSQPPQSQPPQPLQLSLTAQQSIVPVDSPRYNKSSWNDAKKKTDPSIEKEECGVCGKRYGSIYMPLHMRTHGVMPHVCVVCGSKFPNYKGLRSHMVSHSDYRPYECQVCHRTFKRNNEWNMHMRIHSGEKSYRCDICDYSCVQKSNLDIHKRRHMSEYKFTCDICNKGCYTSQELKKHKMTHMDIIHKCKVCGRQFNHKYGLTMHEKTHDPDYKPPVGQYKCDVCGKSYVKLGGLKVHMRKHTGVKPYCCEVCGKSVSSRAILEVHVRTHTGEKPNICEVCGKMFSSQRYLDVHIRSHTGEKPFKCNLCGKSFTQQSSLTVHRRYHSGTRPYKCPTCNKGFVLRNQLKSHQKCANHYGSQSQSETDDPDDPDEPDESCPKDQEDNEVEDVEVVGLADISDVEEVNVDEDPLAESESKVDYSDIQLPERMFSCPDCKETFDSNNDLVSHRKNSCHLLDHDIKTEIHSDSE